MDGSSPLHEFILEWVCYLKQRAHRINRIPRTLAMVRSRNGLGSRYRWLFFHAEGSARRLTAIEREHIRRQLGCGQKAGEQVYVVIKFQRPVGKVIALPATRVLKLARLRADKGGIPWDR